MKSIYSDLMDFTDLYTDSTPCEVNSANSGSEILPFCADDDDAELLLQDARWQPQQVLRVQGRDQIKTNDLSLEFNW